MLTLGEGSHFTTFVLYKHTHTPLDSLSRRPQIGKHETSLAAQSNAKGAEQTRCKHA